VSRKGAKTPRRREEKDKSPIQKGRPGPARDHRE
jgi:hypothetical protein